MLSCYLRRKILQYDVSRDKGDMHASDCYNSSFLIDQETYFITSL
jgi:hypothetical protein